jgi:hypothetical protein
METTMGDLAMFIGLGSLSGAYVIAEKVCGQPLGSGQFGPTIETQCQRNTVTSVSFLVWMLMVASCVTTPMFPTVGFGLSAVCFCVVLVLTCLGFTKK